MLKSMFCFYFLTGIRTPNRSVYDILVNTRSEDELVSETLTLSPKDKYLVVSGLYIKKPEVTMAAFLLKSSGLSINYSKEINWME